MKNDCIFSPRAVTCQGRAVENTTRRERSDQRVEIFIERTRKGLAFTSSGLRATFAVYFIF